jgi:hypothetical protein
MKKIPILLFIIILISCRDEEKYRFFTRLMNNPDNIETIVNEAKFGTKRYQYYLYYDENIKKEEITYLKDMGEYFQNGFTVYEDRISLVGAGWIHKTSHDTCHSIIIKGDGAYLRFKWYLENGIWEFSSISTSRDCENWDK